MNPSNISDPATLAALQQQQVQQAQVATQQPLQTPGASHQQLQQQQLQVLQKFWNEQVTEIQTGVFDFKVHQLPLARIKKVMKADEDVKMISAEAPVLFAKGCDIFITELTLRAWIHAEENKRRTLQRSDIAMAITKTDMFDFLIDIVPREEAPRLPPSHMKSEKMDYRLDPNAAAVPYAHYASYPSQLVDPALLAYQQQALSQAQFMRQQQILQQQQQQQASTQQQSTQPQAQPQQQQQHLGSSSPSNSGASTDRGQTQGQDATSRNSSHQGLSAQGGTDSSAEAYYTQYGQGGR